MSFVEEDIKLLRELKTNNPVAVLNSYKDIKIDTKTLRKIYFPSGLKLEVDFGILVRAIAEKNELALDILLRLPGVTLGPGALYALYLSMPDKLISLVGTKYIKKYAYSELVDELIDDDTAYSILENLIKRNKYNLVYKIPFKKYTIDRYLKKNHRVKKLLKHSSLGKTMLDSKI